MSKFGELLKGDRPVAILFYDEHSDEMRRVFKDVAASIGDGGKFMLIDVNKNEELCDALRIKSVPTVFIYVGGEMMYRKSEVIPAVKLINEILILIPAGRRT